MFSGQNIPRLDGVDKVTGRARYTADIEMAGMWHGVVVRSAIPHGRVEKIEFNSAFDWNRVVAADSKDIPGKNCVAMIEMDVPLIVSEKIMHIGEAILLIAAPARELAMDAVRNVKVVYEEWEPVLTVADAKRAAIKIRGEDNIMSQCKMEKGDTARGFKMADHIVEGSYSMGHQEHMYLETQGMIAAPSDDGGINLAGSIQCPYYVSMAVSILMDLPEDKISVRQAVVGGAFGGKEDYPSILAGYASVLAKKAKRPVRMIYERMEDTQVTTKRHPAKVYHRTGVKNDGTIVAMEILVEMNAGAYVTMTPVVLSRGLIHSAGAYTCENVSARGIAYATNTAPNGAFRGFGVPQVFFPMEVHVDRVAKEIGMPPLEFRRINCVKKGGMLATGQILEESVGAMKCLNEAAKRSSFAAKFKEYAKKNNHRVRRGIGMSLFMHGAGFTGSGESKIKGKAGLRLDPDGRITILTACTEMGQGAHTVLPQMTADFLGVDISLVNIETPDTALVPNSGPTVASRTTMVMGNVLSKCAGTLKQKLSEYASEKFGKRDVKFSDIVKSYLKERGELTVFDHYELPPGIKWDDRNFRGDAYSAYAWGCDVAEVEVDMETFEVRVVKMWMAHDVGRAVNPVMAAGQIEGGTLQALGYALMENHKMEKGKFVTSRFQNYMIPTAPDAPEWDTKIIEEKLSFGPMGAKGLGELPMDGGAPAIVNAIANATGIFVRDLPATPEKLYELFLMSQRQK